MRLFLLAVALLLLCACGGDRWAPGYVITSDGESHSNTDENKRMLTIRTITTQLDGQLGGHWRSETVIDELPKYDRGSDDDGKSAWLWPKATVKVTLIGDGLGESALTDEQVTTAVRDYLYHQVDKPHRNLLVTTSRVVDAPRFAAKPQPAATGSNTLVTKPATDPTSAKRYLVQQGDTWADLSQAFYGTSQHWRHIADANPGVELTHGREIVIPVKP